MWRIALVGSDNDHRFQLAFEPTGELSLCRAACGDGAAAREEALDDPSAAAAVVAVPLAERPYWIGRALDAGKHVLTELPVASSPRQALELAGRVASAGPHLVIAGDLAAGRAGRQLAERGAPTRVGPPVYMRLGVEVPRAWLAGAPEGVLTLFGMAAARLPIQFCGAVDTVYARARALATNRPTEDLAVAQLRFTNGAEGLMEVNGLGDRCTGTMALSGAAGACAFEFDLRPMESLSWAADDLRRVLEGGAPRCGARELAQAAHLVEWILQAARRDTETARADVVLS